MTEPQPSAKKVTEKMTSCEAVRHISECVQSLEDFGLIISGDQRTPPDMIEHVLITDEWGCDECGITNAPVCPSSGLPHRRRLVRVAHDILRTVARKAGKVYTRPADIAERVDGKMRVRTQRRMVMNPQLFLLSFYFANLPAGEADPFTSECAQHLVDLLHQVHTYGKRLESEMNVAYSTALLKSFHTAWKQYVKHAGGEIKSLAHAEKRISKDELFSGTRGALLAAAGESARDPTNEDLRAFVALLYQRVQRLATAEQLAEIREEMDRQAEPAAPPQPDSTPIIRMSNPPLLSDLNTSHSDADPSSPASVQAMGPELPPDWYVDESGRSRPRPGHEERMRQEKFLQKEFKSRKAYEAAMNVKAPQTDNERLVEEVTAAISDAQLQQLSEQLDQSSPKLHMVPQLLDLVQRTLVEALPRRQRPQLEQEFRDALDYNLIVRRSSFSSSTLSNVLQFVMTKVNMYGSPAREAELREETKRVSDDLDNMSPSLGVAVAQAFRFLFRAIRQLREDIAAYSLAMLSSHLRGNAVDYIRDFIQECLPAPTEWKSSLTFLQQFVNDENAIQWAASPASASVTALTASERLLKSALMAGTVDLLRSGHRNSATRWDTLPAEIFYFEKSVVFRAANTVQECTLMLLLEGTVSTMLSGKKLKPVQIADTLRKLHAHIMKLLASDIVLSTLKESVVDFLDSAVTAADAANSGHIQFTVAETNIVLSTIDKMTDTENALYVAFEQKVLSLIRRVIQGEANPPPLGLVTETVKLEAERLARMLVFNWEVYAPTYRQMIPALVFPPSTNAATGN